MLCVLLDLCKSHCYQGLWQWMAKEMCETNRFSQRLQACIACSASWTHRFDCCSPECKKECSAQAMSLWCTSRGTSARQLRNRLRVDAYWISSFLQAFEQPKLVSVQFPVLLVSVHFADRSKHIERLGMPSGRCKSKFHSAKWYNLSLTACGVSCTNEHTMTKIAQSFLPVSLKWQAFEGLFHWKWQVSKFFPVCSLCSSLAWMPSFHTHSPIPFAGTLPLPRHKRVGEIVGSESKPLAATIWALAFSLGLALSLYVLSCV